MPKTPHEVKISRYFDAPVELVYQAFVDPDQIAQWFGPLQFHVPRDSVSIEAQAGGHWHMTMVNNNTSEWKAPVAATLVEAVENRLLVGYEIANGFPGMEDGTKISLSLEFFPEGDGTRLELRQGPFPEEMSQMSEIGWNQSLYKLQALLVTPARFRSNTAPGD